jgi:hypothetical protein
MANDVISRRRLLASGVQASAALAVAGTLGPAAVSATAGVGDTASAVATQPATLTFYDPRFPVSRRRARALPGRPRLRPIQGDPTALMALVAEARAGGVRRLQGVTTESIPFCLKEYAGRGRGVRLECRRVDRDLFVWTLTLGSASS